MQRAEGATTVGRFDGVKGGPGSFRPGYLGNYSDIAGKVTSRSVSHPRRPTHCSICPLCPIPMQRGTRARSRQAAADRRCWCSLQGDLRASAFYDDVFAHIRKVSPSTLISAYRGDVCTSIGAGRRS